MECGFPASRLEVEITEKALVKDMAAAKQVIAALRSAGVKVLLDDFGAGYSGLGYLRELELDGIKIDRSFISTLRTQEKSRKIIKAIQDLATSLGLATVAEGIENEEIWDGREPGRLHLRPGLLHLEGRSGERSSRTAGTKLTAAAAGRMRLPRLVRQSAAS